jgi:predicted outer membrane repeat protein
VLDSCVFTGNAAVFGGAAIYALDLNEIVVGRLEIQECRFSANTAGYHGGAIYATGVGLQVTNSMFVGNVCASRGGGMLCDGFAEGLLENCLFFGNSSQEGIIFSNFSQLTLEKVIIAKNLGGAAVECVDSLSEPSLSCCDVYGNEGGDWIGCIESQSNQDGNISLDPLFCDESSQDFRLQPGSPCAPSGSCDLMGPLPVGCSPTSGSKLEGPERGRRILMNRQ